jgi:glutathione synthase/RimK-type ligase-like ATP-grasp enzyme
VSILLWGLPDDSPISAVKDALDVLRAQYVFLDQRDIAETRISLRVGRAVTGLLECAGTQLQLANITAFYLRPYDTRRLPAVAEAGEDSCLWRHALAMDEILLAWADLSTSMVVNRPSAAASNNSKPYQAMLIRAFGFNVPESIIITDPAEVESFRVEHGDIIYKSISGIRSIVSRFTSGDQNRLADVAWCPTQFQEYIVGRDYRVHVIGHDVYACEVISEADDYRYAARDGIPADVRPAYLSSALVERCRLLTAGLGLWIAGIDLRLAQDGRWYCFEVNPSPGFTYYERATGQPLALSVARLLMQAPVALDRSARNNLAPDIVIQSLCRQHELRGHELSAEPWDTPD